MNPSRQYMQALQVEVRKAQRAVAADKAKAGKKKVTVKVEPVRFDRRDKQFYRMD